MLLCLQQRKETLPHHDVLGRLALGGPHGTLSIMPVLQAGRAVLVQASTAIHEGPAGSSSRERRRPPLEAPRLVAGELIASDHQQLRMSLTHPRSQAFGRLQRPVLFGLPSRVAPRFAIQGAPPVRARCDQGG